ncbi:MAG: beta-galactosidase [Actinomycetota bacterium]
MRQPLQAGCRRSTRRRAIIGAAREVSADTRLFRIGDADRYLLSGEFHYFRVPRQDWADRLRLMRDIGLTATSIYVPWNWHQPDPDSPPDLDGRTSPERNLRAAFDEIEAADLDCIFRPGPFITAEWRNGGIPDWVWELEPGVLALDVDGGVSAPDHPYPAITHAHPAYRAAEAAWLEASCAIAVDHLASRGGSVIDVQIDDEPSYWQRIASGSLAVDYNPILIASPGDGAPSRFGDWLLDRYGSLDAVNGEYGTAWSRATDIEPPREQMMGPGDLPRHADWFDFKLHEVNLDMEHQYRTVVGAGIDVPISMLFPYLLALDAVRFTDFIEDRGLPIHLTNEVYLSLFGPNSCDERKLGDIVASHETYTGVWLRGHGPAISMELQGSNSTNITPAAMELLYAMTVARGIKGINIYMMVGGQNPPGFENVTGRGYDIAAPIAKDGSERPHAGVLRKLAKVIEAGGRALLDAEPLRDTWIGCLATLERAAIVGGDGPMAAAAELLATTFSGGEMGMSNAASLPALMVNASVSFGAVDLERATPEELAALPQVWVPGLPHLDRRVQESLVRALAHGAHLVVLPEMPRLDEHGAPCELLWDACMDGIEVTPPDPRAAAEAMHMLTTPQGESLVAPGRRWSYTLPEGAHALVHDMKSGLPVAFTRSVGDGRVTLLGFNLRYVPNEQDDQKDFLERIVTGDGARPLGTRPTDRRIASMQLASPAGCFVCLVNPVELPASTRVHCTGPGGEAVTFPQEIEGVSFEGAGARLLPVGLDLGDGITLDHATWELLAIDRTGEGVGLTFATPGVAYGEIRVTGAPVTAVGLAHLTQPPGDDGLLVLDPAGDICQITVGGSPAYAYTHMQDRTEGGAP